jgi:hypothetical protein
MLMSCASEFRLRLHGSSWETGSEGKIKESWKGFLPKDNIADAYNSAKVVLASTIREQADFGMINNRIFEALACGSLVISDRFEALSEMFGDLIFFVNRSDEFQKQLGKIIATPDIDLASHRERARETIMKYHTWNHRVISIFEFYTSFENNLISPRVKKPVVALIVSEDLRKHGDYLFSIKPALFKYLYGEFIVQEYDLSSWESLQSQTPLESLRFSIIVAIFSPYDAIHQNFLKHFHLESQRVVLGRNSLQKILCYVFGTPPPLELVMASSPPWYETLTDIFDVILYRDSYEMGLLVAIEEEHSLSRCHFFCFDQHLLRQKNREKRWQHAFGIVAPTPPLLSPRPLPVVICWNVSMSLCTQQVRESVLQKSAYTLMLIGGRFADWLDFCNSKLDCVLNPNNLSEILSQTLYFPNYQDEVFSTICASQKVYLLFDVRNQNETLRDQLWPLVTAAVCDRPIHFLHHPGAHLTKVISDGCDNWNEEYTKQAWKHGFERLHGLASSRSTITIVSNYQSGATYTIDQLTNEPLVFQPMTEHFIAGRDGKICLHFLGTSRICLIREYLQLEIVVPPIPPISCLITLNFTLVLQSHLFADTIRHSMPFQLQICPAGFECIQNTSTISPPLADMEKVYYKIGWEEYSSSCPGFGKGDV